MKIKQISTKITEDLNKNLIEGIDDNPAIEVSDGGKTVEVDVAMTSKDPASASPAAKEDALNIKNALTEVLDLALSDAKSAIAEENYHANCNVLVTGLPGSSKTATIRNWCNQNGCNLFYLDAKNPDLQLLTSGASAIDRTDPAHPKVNTAYSNALAKLDRPNSVLFLDELNRQTREYMRGSLLTLLADRSVAGDGEEGTYTFKNLLFSIAAINPAKDGDRGASELNDAEKRRFYFHCIFNSEVKTTEVYFNQYYDNKIRQRVKSHPDLTDEDIQVINSFCLRQWIGNKIINDGDFHYTTIDEYESSTEKGQITCQSLITELIDHSKGNLDRLKRDIRGGDLTDSAKKMLLQIIDSLVLPNPNVLRAYKAKELGLDLKASIETSAAKPVEMEDEDSFTDADFETAREDDEDWGGATATAVDSEKAKIAKESDAAVEAKLKKFADALAGGLGF